MVDRSATYRLRALSSEQRAQNAADSAVKREWEDLAIQWHLMANEAAQASGQAPLIDVG
jgi:hypothetical protein